ncbi:turripeptide Lol9.1-like [Rhodnius prolixus]|uniref:Putative kazalzinho kazal-type serine protease inhibitor n=1 Tax=Rhodnius prolixus TaxID=13249 RepID=R4G7W0_RHOPR
MKIYILILASLLSAKADLAILQRAGTEKPVSSCKVKICQTIWLPVCGTDGKNNITFGNQCAMDKANCFVETKYTLLNDGICKRGG